VDFQIPDDVRLIGDSLLAFIDAEVVPLEAANASLLNDERQLYTPEGRYAPEVLRLRKQVRRLSAEAGYYTALGASDLGGGGLGPVAAAYLQELLARTYGPSRVLIHHVVIPSAFTNGLTPVLQFLQPEARERYLPAIATGEHTLCFGLSEPDAGSDVLAMRTRAVRDGDDWVITGTKQWITNSPYADYAVIFAVTDSAKAAARKGGVTAFLVDARSPGFDVTSVLRVMGHLGGDTGIIVLDGVRVPDGNRLGEVDRGLGVAMHGVNAGRLGVASSCVGYAQWALALATEYAKVRKTFGRPIGEHQAIQIHLAECAMDIFAARSALLHCAWRVEQGSDARAEIAIVKALCTEMLGRVTDRCMQVHGGMGMTNEVGLQALYRFARPMRIYDGTAEIQRRTIALELLNGALRF
jgi:acyl-CoA dehydrogenase